MRKLILVLALLPLLNGCGSVDTGHRGIWVKFGEVIGEPVSEGLYWYNPFFWSLIEYPVREETWSGTTEIFTFDTQKVMVDFSYIFHVEPTKVGHLYKTIGRSRQVGDNIITPLVLGSLKDAIGQIKADNLVGKREAVTRAALAEVAENLKSRNIIVTDLQFTNIKFDPEYEKAVEEKVVATQDAQKAVNVSVTIKEQAKQKIMMAQADAESMRIKSQALSQNQGLVQFEAVQKWDGKLPVYMMGNSTPFIDMRNLGK